MATLSERHLGYGHYGQTYKATPDPAAATIATPTAGSVAATDIWEEVVYYPGVPVTEGGVSGTNVTVPDSNKTYRLIATAGTVVLAHMLEFDA